MSQKRGKFIVLEGGEGVGKSTNLAFVRACLETAGLSVRMTREPGGTRLGERLREILLQADEDEPITPDAELLLMFAARAQHIARVIAPALAEGQWVVCDRFTDATYAYQGGGRRLPMGKIADLEQWVQGDLRPDLVLLLDAPAGVGLNRVRRRGGADRFEREEGAFFERVRAVYRARAGESDQHYAVIDAGLELAQVQVRIEAVIKDFLARTAAAG